MNSFKRNQIIGYGITLLLLIVSSAASFISISNLLDSQKMVNHTNVVINKLANVLAVAKDRETGQRVFLVTGDERFLEPYSGAYDKSVRLINEIKSLTADNPQQQLDCDLLHRMNVKSFKYLDSLIIIKRQNGTVTNDALLQEKTYTDAARKLVNTMQQREQLLLDKRIAKLNQFAAATPALILIAAVLSIIITLISFFRVNADFNKRAALQGELEQKDKDITQRIAAIENIAVQISSGDYAIRVVDEEKDKLGSLALSLNNMALSLEKSFNELTEREWLKTGVAELNEQIKGELDVQTLSNQIIEYVAEYTGSAAGAIYLLNEDNLEFSGGFAFIPSEKNKILQRGKGIAGQAVQSGKEIIIKDIPLSAISITYLGGEIKPNQIIALPLFFGNAIKGVIELASVKEFTQAELSFLRTVSHTTGIAINTAKNRQRLQELLQETQAQAEEMQAQNNEMENINAELQAQAEKLQASEEELRVQQEELQQANGELEERAQLLEEKNNLILERNLEIQAKAEELELSTKYKSEFLANMSHELRTPLNSILLLSRLLSENHVGNLSPDQIEYATVIQSSGNGLLTLIDEILDLSKIESGKMELEYTDVKMEEITGELTSLFSPLAKEKGIEFIIEVTQETPALIETDRLRLQQILRNLISNALKFTKKGSVTLHTGKEASAVFFTVEDTGIGIPKEKQQTIFEAFQQADGSTRRQFGGTGLGLSISRELASLLSGEITVKSEEGRGSEFTLMIPAAKEKKIPFKPKPVEEKKVAKVEKEQEYLASFIPASLADDRENITKNDKVILIVEDDTAFARSLLDFTRQKGYKGIVAVRGDEGVKLAKQYLPMSILLDIQLPVKSGWEVMEELKSDIATRPIPVHMMSSLEAKAKSLSKGAVDFLYKPVAFEKMNDIFQKIEEALRRYPKKVLIIEENLKHAQALAFFLEGFKVHTEIENTVEDSITALNQSGVDCVILDMDIPTQQLYDRLEEVKKSPGFENLPIIIFTGKNLSYAEEMRIKQYADSIVIKTAHSYQRILDEVSLFLHVVEENKSNGKPAKYKRMGELHEVLKGKTVLVADDDVRNIFSLTKALENYGMEVVSAMDGKDALKQLDEAPKIDLVLMDMMMPEMDGYESTKHIRKIPKYRNLPVIAVTAKAMTGDREKCISAGASDYITKPVDVDQLISLLRVWLYE